MKTIAVALLITAGLLFLTTGPIELAAAERAAIGQVERAQGTVSAEFEGAARALAEDAEVLFRDQLVTGEKARLLAKLVDGTELTLGENGRLLIDELIYDPNQADSSLVVDVTAGAFLFVAGRIEDVANPNVTIKTPVATIGVRGTTLWGGAIDGGFGVLVLDGQVVVSTAGGSVQLTPGQGTMIFDPAAGPTPVVTWGQEKVDRAVATISFAE